MESEGASAWDVLPGFDVKCLLCCEPDRTFPRGGDPEEELLLLLSELQPAARPVSCATAPCPASSADHWRAPGEPKPSAHILHVEARPAHRESLLSEVLAHEVTSRHTRDAEAVSCRSPHAQTRGSSRGAATRATSPNYTSTSSGSGALAGVARRPSSGASSARRPSSGGASSVGSMFLPVPSSSAEFERTMRELNSRRHPVEPKQTGSAGVRREEVQTSAAAILREHTVLLRPLA